MNFTDEQIDKYLEGIRSGKYDASTNLPKDLYKAIGDHLMGGLVKGATMTFGERNPELIRQFQENVYMFSAAKTYQQVKEMSTFLSESATLQEFKEKVMPIYNDYNVNWLRAEFNTAYGQGTIANQWDKIEKEKEIFPYLRYSAVMDANTSEICAGFNGTTLPVNDSFWDNFSPLNHFNCRCVLEQVDEFSGAVLTSDKDKADIMAAGKESVDDVFQMNPYRDQYVFSPDHPYFQVAPRDKAFAEDNFGLPIPEPIVPLPEEPAKEFNYDFSKMKGDEMKRALVDMFRKNGELTIQIPADAFNVKLGQEVLPKLQELMNDYKIDNRWKNFTQIRFKSTQSSYGVVKRYGSTGRFAEINFGNKLTPFADHKYVEGATSLRQFSRVDLSNHKYATLVHEFTHVISTDFAALAIKDKEQMEFFKELGVLQKNYVKDFAKAQAKSPKAAYEMHLGRYAHTNLNEFMAEGFTEYKLSSNPSKYATEIGKLVDKYFKK